MRIIKRSFPDNADFPEYSVLNVNPQTHEEAVNDVKDDIISMYADSQEEKPTSLDELFGDDYKYREFKSQNMIVFADENFNLYEYFIME